MSSEKWTMRLTKEPMEYGMYLVFGSECGLEPFTYSSHVRACKEGYGYNIYSDFLVAHIMTLENKAKEIMVFIAGVAVKKEERRKKHLTNFIEYIIKRTNASKVSLAVDIKNVPMLNFVDKFGFKKVDAFDEIKDAIYYEYTCP